MGNTPKKGQKVKKIANSKNAELNKKVDITTMKKINDLTKDYLLSLSVTNNPNNKNNNLKTEPNINIEPIIDEEPNTDIEDFMIYSRLFGNGYSSSQDFLEVYNFIFQLSMRLPTTFYTLTYKEVEDIIDKSDMTLLEPIISSHLSYLVIFNKEKIYSYNNCQNIYMAIRELFINKTDFQKEIICSIMKSLDFPETTFSMIKLFQDIGFCIRILYYTLKSKLLKDQYCYEYEFDIRILYFLNLIEDHAYKKEFPEDLMKLATKSARIKDTIILGNKQFRNHIIYLNLPNDRITDLDDNSIEYFFQHPFIEEKQYKVVRYFVICEEADFKNKYLLQFKNLSAKYGFAYLFLVSVKNKKLDNFINNLSEQYSAIYFFSDYQLKEIYKDNNERLRPRLREYMIENYSSFKLQNYQFEKEFIHVKIEELKSNSEEGWDLFELKKDSINFNFSLISANFQDFIRHIIGNFIKAYKDHNSLEIFFKYYSNYFFLTLQPEFVVNMTAFVKMFLYAYTLEEGNKDQNLYCIVNDDLRSCIPDKVNRYIELIKVIGGLIKTQKLKSYNGYVYRASFLKEELINKIKVGDTIMNSAFWSSTKKESVAKNFLRSSHKNALIITKGELINNVDIHLEQISKYPSEEEVLFLPFCNFKIISINKVFEGNNSYYKLVLQSESETSLIEPYIKRYIKTFDFEKIEKEDNENVLVINFDEFY